MIFSFQLSYSIFELAYIFGTWQTRLSLARPLASPSLIHQYRNILANSQEGCEENHAGSLAFWLGLVELEF